MLIKNLIFALSLLLFSCKKVKHESMTVVKDCTGVYLRHEGKDYHVCNTGKLANYANGASVMASFKTINDCGDEAEPTVCLMYHENEGWVEVKSIQ